MADLTVAKTILEQLGGELFVAMTGAKNFVGTEDSLTSHLLQHACKSSSPITLASISAYCISMKNRFVNLDDGFNCVSCCTSDATQNLTKV